MAYLLVLKGLNAKQSITLDKDRSVLGRNANCDVVFPANDFAVSREHACILRVQYQFFIEDLGSRNGTYVNNQPVASRQPLRDGDKIRIDIPNRTIDVLLSDDELARRREEQNAKGWKPAKPRPRKVTAALKAYAKLVMSADKGAVRDVSLLDD